MLYKGESTIYRSILFESPRMNPDLESGAERALLFVKSVLSLQRPQVPCISISKCAACQKHPQAEDEKVKRCTRCYRVGYCNT